MFNNYQISSLMKKIFFAVLALVALTMQAKVNPEVSETVELLSILSRTAGSPEYNMDMGGKYTEDVEAWFSQYKDHPIISCFQDLQQNYGIYYNAPISLAVNLEIEGGKIKMVGKKELLDDRWMNVDPNQFNEFIAKLNEFYTDTRFHEFFQQHQEFYKDVLRQYETNVMQYFNQDWYARFYGTEPGEIFRIIVGFTNGGQNYGANREVPGKPSESFAICGYWVHPQMGSVLDPENAKQMAAPTLIHEFNHSFVNPLIETEKNAALMGDIPQRLLEQNSNMMAQQAYGVGNTVFNESVVRAATIIYMMENGYSPEDVQSELVSHIARGFKWMPELVAALRDYNANRGKYPTLNDFYPQVAKVLRNYLNTEDKRIDKVMNLGLSLDKSATTASNLKAEVMETVELMSILSRTAGYDEYNKYTPSTYSQDIEQWFASFQQHPAVEYFQQLRSQYHIAYDAPISLAVRLAVENGKVVKLPEEAGDNGLDDRWDNVNMNEFLGLLNQFYTDTRFHDFFQQHQSYYQKELSAFNEDVMPLVNPNWTSDFLGKPINHQNKVVIGFATCDDGGYGAFRHLKGQMNDVFTVIGYTPFDQNDQDRAERRRNSLAMMISGMLAKDLSQPSPGEEKDASLLSEVGDKMINQMPWLRNMFGFPDGQTLVDKCVEDAADIIHLNMMGNNSSSQQASQKLANYLSSGFSWMPDLVTALADYATHRNKYNSINDFHPQIAQVLSKSLAVEQQRFDKALK